MKVIDKNEVVKIADRNGIVRILNKKELIDFLQNRCRKFTGINLDKYNIGFDPKNSTGDMHSWTRTFRPYGEKSKKKTVKGREILELLTVKELRQIIKESIKGTGFKIVVES